MYRCRGTNDFVKMSFGCSCASIQCAVVRGESIYCSKSIGKCEKSVSERKKNETGNNRERMGKTKGK